VFLVVPHRGQQVRDMVVKEAVVGVAALSTYTYESNVTEQAQVVGGGALLDGGQVGQLVNCLLAVEQQKQNSQSGRSAQRPHGCGDLNRLLISELSVRRMVFRWVGHPLSS